MNDETCPVCKADTPPDIISCPTCGVNLEIARKEKGTPPSKPHIEYKDQLEHSLGGFVYVLIGFLFANLAPVLIYLLIYVIPIKDVSFIFAVLILSVFCVMLYFSTIGRYGKISLLGVTNIFAWSFIPLANWWVAYYLGRGLHMQISKQKLHKPDKPIPIGLILIILISVFSAIMSLDSATPQAPAPHRTATSARPPTAKPHPATSTPQSPCLLWSKVTPQMVGDTVCVYGVVSSVHANYQVGQSFIYFGTEDQFFITNEFKWEDLKGQCTKVEGVIGINTYHVPYILTDNLYDCDPWME